MRDDNYITRKGSKDRFFFSSKIKKSRILIQSSSRLAIAFYLFEGEREEERGRRKEERKGRGEKNPRLGKSAIIRLPRPVSRLVFTRRDDPRGEATPSRCSVHGVYGDDGPGGGWQIERDGANKGAVTKERAKRPGWEGGETGVEKFNCAYFRSDVSQILRHRAPFSLFFLSFSGRRARPRKTGMTLRDHFYCPLYPIFNLFLSLSLFFLLVVGGVSLFRTLREIFFPFPPPFSRVKLNAVYTCCISVPL